MHLHYFLLFCMLCLMVAAQAAPAAAGQMGHASRRAQRRKSDVVRARRGIQSPEIVEVVGSVTRDLKAEEATAAAARQVVLEAQQRNGVRPNHYFSGPLNPKGQEMFNRYQAYEQDARLQRKVKERQMHYADTLHIATHGQKSTKFPMITRVSASIGAVAAVMNVFNTVIAAKTTHAATVPFSSPPTPPTLLDNAGHWDGESVTLLKPPPTSNPKNKRELSTQHETSVEKRWLLAAGAGTAVGAMFAPGFWGMIRGKKSDAPKPPFDPYNPDVLKQNDPYAILATSPGQPAPQVNPVAANTGTGLMAEAPADSPARIGSGGFSAPVLEPVSQSTTPISSNLVPVLQKRTDGPHETEELEKRQFVNGAGSSLWSKIAMAATAGSAIPLIYHGVTHSRWRTEHPRDREIIGELDDTPTYGAVGVPNRVPGQIATYAMPGFTTYTQQVQAEQLVAQQKLVLEQQRQLTAGNGGTLPSTAISATEPVLSKRSLGQPLAAEKELSLVKRGKMLVGGMLAAFGLALGYLQSATQFPEDREAEKDKKKKDAQKKLLEQQQQQSQTQQAALTGVGAPVSLGGTAGVVPQGFDTASTVGGGLYSPLQASTGTVSSFAPAQPPNLTPVGSNAGPSLPASFAPVPMSGTPVLNKRSDRSDAHVEKRLLGMGAKAGRFLEISGLTMFFGTLAANIMVSTKQQTKPVPYVTPNADTKGPVPLGGDLYVQYLQSKQSGSTPQTQSAFVPGTAATVPMAISPATAGTAMPVSAAGLTSAAIGAPVLQKRRPFGTSENPMLSKRLVAGFGLFRAATVVAESSAGRTAGIQAIEKTGTLLATERVAAGGAARVAEASLGAGAGAGATGLHASESAAGGMLGAAQPAMMRMPVGSPASTFAMGRAGLPAVAPVAGDLRLVGSVGAAEPAGLAAAAGRGSRIIEAPVAGEAAMAPEAEAAKKKNTMSKIGILTTAAGVTMLANGAV